MVEYRVTAFGVQTRDEYIYIVTGPAGTSVGAASEAFRVHGLAVRAGDLDEYLGLDYSVEEIAPSR